MNAFRQRIVDRLEVQESRIDHTPLSITGDRAGWTHEPSRREAPPALLQGRRLVVDVTDQAITLYPLGLTGRYRMTTSLGPGRGERTVVYRPGRAVLVDNAGSTTIRVSAVLPVVELARDTGPSEPWIADGETEHLLHDDVWCYPENISIDETIARNNSTVPDPLPIEAAPAGVLARAIGPRIIIAVAASRRAAADALDAWERGRQRGIREWDTIAQKLNFTVPDERLTRQSAFSIHASLAARSIDQAGRDIFVHGRRDRGYADTAHLHQSYQMHLPALAAGEGLSVKAEIIAFLALQESTGWIERAPRPIAGTSTYVGRYTGVHVLLALERYVCWTGDIGILSERVTSALDRKARTIRERAALVVDDLLAHTHNGLIRPCGWADAWNPEVLAQGQISAASVLGLKSWARILQSLGDRDGAAGATDAATAICAQVRSVLLDPITGIVAEHLFPWGTEGGTPDDFYAHTQIWAALAGVTTDGRGLDRVHQTCIRHGVSIAPESAFDREYVAASTDSAADLPVDSTATWLLATWPEVTHLMAMAELERGQPDTALDLVLAQLPETLHRLDPVSPPWFYAEKYLYPGTRPWLCTWAGDPTLIELLLTGFLGVRPNLDALHVEPQLPSTWIGSHGAASFIWRGKQITLRLDPDLGPRLVRVDGRDCAAGEAIAPEIVHDGTIIHVSSAE